MLRTPRTVGPALVGIVAVAALLSRRSLTPPALLAVEPGEVAVPEHYPAGTELVELEAASGIVLRGLWVPADEGAPVVVHFQESSATCFPAWSWRDRSHLFSQLADLGFASLVVDYGGVGGSRGERSVRNLRRDAWAIWNEALRRAGNHPDYVVLHGTSIGTLAISILLADGARPGGVVLVAPVARDTVTYRAARVLYGRWAGRFAQWICAPVSEVDLRDVPDRGAPPLLAIQGRGDSFTSAAEREEFRRTVESGGGTWVLRGRGHVGASAFARHLHEEEITFLEAVQPCTPPVDERLSRVLRAMPASLASPRVPRISDGWPVPCATRGAATRCAWPPRPSRRRTRCSPRASGGPHRGSAGRSPAAPRSNRTSSSCGTCSIYRTPPASSTPGSSSACGS